MEQLIVCPTEDRRFAVRPVSWAGIWGKNGLLTNECNSLAYFEDEQDAKDYIAYRALGTVEELSALVKARDEGRVHIAPIRDGTAIFYHIDEDENMFPEFEDGILEGIYVNGYTECICGEMGVGWFLTRAEAEAALKGETHETDPV